MKQEQIVKPGDKLLIAITLPQDSDPLHPEIMLEDFMQSPCWTEWQVEIHSVQQKRRCAVFDRKVDALPTEKCPIEIFTEEKWFACEWTPRTPESEADAGYLGTARTTDRPIQIGFHAWEQNDSEFRYFCLPANK